MEKAPPTSTIARSAFSGDHAVMQAITAGCEAILLFIAVAGVSAVWVLNAMHHSVTVEQPTKRQLEEEDHLQHALFRHLPALKSRLAWRQLGNFPTPIHRVSCDARPAGATLQAPSKTVNFFVKREDLASEAYGGNKVRTLQHTLASIEAHVERGGAKRELFVFGSGGSNQVVATVVHALRTKLTIATSALWIADPPDLDNTLNMCVHVSECVLGR